MSAPAKKKRASRKVGQYTLHPGEDDYLSRSACYKGERNSQRSALARISSELKTAQATLKKNKASLKEIQSNRLNYTASSMRAACDRDYSPPIKREKKEKKVRKKKRLARPGAPPNRRTMYKGHPKACDMLVHWGQQHTPHLGDAWAKEQWKLLRTRKMRAKLLKELDGKIPGFKDVYSLGANYN